MLREARGSQKTYHVHMGLKITELRKDSISDMNEKKKRQIASLLNQFVNLVKQLERGDVVRGFREAQCEEHHFQCSGSWGFLYT